MPSLRGLIRALDGTRRAMSETFRPSHRASSREVRWHGMITIAVGALLIAAAGSLAFGLARFGVHAFQLLMLPSLVAYPMFAFGGYRLIVGAEPADAGDSALASLRRIAIAVTSIVFGSVVAWGVLMGVVYALGVT